jgi:hypothetical protein
MTAASTPNRGPYSGKETGVKARRLHCGTQMLVDDDINCAKSIKLP